MCVVPRTAAEKSDRVWTLVTKTDDRTKLGSVDLFNKDVSRSTAKLLLFRNDSASLG